MNKSLSGIDGIGSSSLPPRYWYSYGNYVLNKCLTGSMYHGPAQGRMQALVGPSGCLPAGEEVTIYEMKTIPAYTPVEQLD
jgi:hypothetical protein